MKLTKFAAKILIGASLVFGSNVGYASTCSVLKLSNRSDREICSKTALITRGSNNFGANKFDLEARKRKLDCQRLMPANNQEKYPEFMKNYSFQCMQVREVATEFYSLFLNGSSAENATNYLLQNLKTLDEAKISVDDFVGYVQDADYYGSKEHRASQFGTFVAKQCEGNENTSVESRDTAQNIQSNVPRYDVDAYCENVKEFSGGSNQIYNSCIDAQQEAYNSLKRTYSMVPAETADYCDEVAEFSGGSYQILKTCIEQENKASGGKKKFKF